jgi:oxygen-independent coproporphyrinogen-3 oxidase
MPASARAPKVAPMHDAAAVRFDPDLIRRYDGHGPRYTSYPTAVVFDPGFGLADYQRAAARSNDDPIPKPLSLYLHLPFCQSPCFYCGCTKVITRDRVRGDIYLLRLEQEIALQGALFDRDRSVDQLHLGGGTPTFFDSQQLERLMRSLGEHFALRDDDGREYSIELDPRTVSPEYVERLAGMGFNRASLGVQDFEPRVQQAVNRVQSVDDTLAILQAARRAGFRSLSVDLIYGLPLQTVESFGRTLDIVVAARPDRVAAYSYAHLPTQFKPQTQIDPAQLPSAAVKLELLGLTIERLTRAGYVYIGMDHFALPDDELAVALRDGSLQRNFQGYSTRAGTDLVGMGMSAIGAVGDCFVQLHKSLDTYYGPLDRGELPVWRGHVLTTDDKLRRDVIQGLMCQGVVEFAPLEYRYGMCFARYFSVELERLAPLAEDGLIELAPGRVEVTPAGRLLVRQVAMVFDAYLPPPEVSAKPRFSRVI